MKIRPVSVWSGLTVLTAIILAPNAGCSSTPPEGNLPPERPFTQEERDKSIRDINANRGAYGGNIPGAPATAGKNMNDGTGSTPKKSN